MRHYASVVFVGILVSFGFLVSPVTAETSVQQSSSATVNQNAQVSGGSTHVEQDAHVRTETGDTVVERSAELEATKKTGEPVQVERDTDRHTVNPENASVSGDIDQSVTTDDGTLSTGQQVTQSVTDRTEAEEQEAESAAYADADTATDTAKDTTAASTTPQKQTVRQEMSGVVTTVIDTLTSAVTALLP
jgi:hypothetical protein